MYSKQCSQKVDMNLLSFYALIGFIVFFHPLFGCKANANVESNLTLATFNIAWLGDGKEPETIKRNQEDLARIADIINETSADVIALQEIENQDAINQILLLLPEYKAIIGNKGRSQNVGFLYKSTINIQDNGEYTPIAIDPNRNRPGYVLNVKKGNFDFLIMSVHFKSTSRYDSTDELRAESRKTRYKQSRMAINWMDSLLQAGKEQDMFIIGDFNDFPKRVKEPTLLPLSESISGSFLTAELKSCKFQNLFAIDHIFASNSAKKRFVANSERVIDLHSMYPKDIAEKISDHCPIIMQFDISQTDND